MLKTSIYIGVLIGGSALAAAQAPAGPGALPIGGADSGMEPPVVSSRTASTLDLRPLADASTPYACACAEFQIDEFLAASVTAVATPTSLPGLGEQTAEFLQNQGGGESGAPDDSEEGGSPLDGLSSGEAPSGGGLAAAPGSDADDGGSEEGEAQGFSASLPADLERNSPFPQPFQLASIVNVDLAVAGPESGDSEQSEEDDAESEREEFEDDASDEADNAEEQVEEL